MTPRDISCAYISRMGTSSCSRGSIICSSDWSCIDLIHRVSLYPSFVKNERTIELNVVSISLLYSSIILERICWTWQIKTHHWSRFHFDIFSWILLYFYLCFRAHCRTELTDMEQVQQMIPLITCEVSFSQNVSKLVFGVDVLDLDFGGPDWFDWTTNQAQLSGSWKHVSLSDFCLS